MVRFGFGMALGLLLSLPAQAAEIVSTAAPSDPQQGIIVIAGDIAYGDEGRFRDHASRYSQATVILQSGGGNLHAGVVIGEIIRQRRFTTRVPENEMCASACALAWLGGTTRYMTRSARVGFHAPFRSDGSENAWGGGKIGAYIARLGLPDRTVDFILTAGPSEMTWLDPDDAWKVGIDVMLLADASQSPPPDVAETPPSVRQTFVYVDFLRPNEGLNVRSGPGEDYQSFVVLKNGTRLELLRSDRNWRFVRLPDGVTGWSSANYLRCCETVVAQSPRPTFDPPATGSLPSPRAETFVWVKGAVLGGSVNLRAEPDADQDNIVALMPAGTRLTFLGRRPDGEWSQLRTVDGRMGWAKSTLLRFPGRGGGASDGRPLAFVTNVRQALPLRPVRNLNAPGLDLPPGTPLVVVSQQDGWSNVRVPDLNGSNGWVLSKHVGCCR